MRLNKPVFAGPRPVASDYKPKMTI